MDVLGRYQPNLLLVWEIATGQELYPAGTMLQTLGRSASIWQTWALVLVYFTTFGGFMALTGWFPKYWQGCTVLKSPPREVWLPCIPSSLHFPALPEAAFPTGSISVCDRGVTRGGSCTHVTRFSDTTNRTRSYGSCRP